jgi:aminopeptidase-like protein
MNIDQLKAGLNIKDAGQDMYKLMSELYPICRSITGEGLRQTLKIIGRHIPIVVHEVPTGTNVFDWTIPNEWNIRDAYIKNSKGDRVIDFQDSNLHLVGYSVPVKKKMSLQELKTHLFTLPEYPDWIPYRTSYYKKTWGFCLSHNQLLSLKDDEYEVCIDSSLRKGHLSYGEFLIPGETDEELLISTHICHPSLCNDNLSAIVVATYMAEHLSSFPLRYSYRFIFIPGTIGSITWLAQNQNDVGKIKHGLVLACIGDAGGFTYKKSRQENAEIDQCVSHILNKLNEQYDIIDFFPYGYDERQYCSPGFNLPVGCLMRTPYGKYPEYHTSADNLDFIQPDQLSNSFDKLLQIVNIVEGNKKYLNTNPKCEPHLGKRGLYKLLGGENQALINQINLLWVLNMSDGNNSLLDIAQKSNLEFTAVRSAADILLEHGLLIDCSRQNNIRY